MNLTATTHSGLDRRSFSEQVVVIEDDPVVRRLLRMCLYRAGLDALAFESGDEAVEFLATQDHSVSLVITDGVMPGLDGFGVARWCQGNLPGTPIVLLSGYLNHFVAQTNIPENIEAFFTKPFSTRELVAKILDLTRAVA